MMGASTGIKDVIVIIKIFNNIHIKLRVTIMVGSNMGLLFEPPTKPVQESDAKERYTYLKYMQVCYNSYGPG